MPQFLSTVGVLLKDGGPAVIIGAVISLLLIAVYLFLIRYVLFKPHTIVEKLQLDKNFDEEKFELNIHRSTIIKIALIFIGGMILLDYFVPFVLNIYSYVKAKNQSGIMDLIDTFGSNDTVTEIDLMQGGLMTLVGYFIITNTRLISNWFEKLRKK